jgi:hypothetical protein
MLRNKLVRSDGSVIDSSVIISCEFTEEVNCGTNLSFGDVTSSELTVEIRSTEAIQQGEVFTYYMIEDDVEKLIGEFIAEKPTVASRSSIRFAAYDNVSKTEKPFSDWLRDNQSLFPMTPMELVTHVCSHCGVTYSGGEFPNQGISINAFYADDITGRQILSWVGALAGRFIRANAAGEIEFAQYAENAKANVTYKKGDADPINLTVTDDNGRVAITSDDMIVTDDGDGNVIVTLVNVMLFDFDGDVKLTAGTAIPYSQGSLSYETYHTDLVERVQIKHSDNDVGVVYPADVDGNTYVISQNMLLGTCSLDDVTAVAQTLYRQLSSISYVPFSVTIPRTVKIRAGDIVAIKDVNGNSFYSIVMKMSVTGGGVTISSTGDKSYGSTTAVAFEKFTNLTGKVLEISKTVNGLSIANKSLDGRVGSLELSTESFQAQIRKDVDNLSQITMTPDQVEILVSDAVSGIDSVKTSTGYTFDKDGLDIHKDGEAMHNTLDHEGMYVRKNSEDVLIADKDGVNAINLTARKYLIVGENARFEDYQGNRTACFYIGG